MTEQDPGHSGYIGKVREDTSLYIKNLLGENKQLRLDVAGQASENERLIREVTALRRELDERNSREVSLQLRLTEIHETSEQYIRQFADLEQHNANLANLYVASYQLHGTLNREAVVTVIQEIIINLVGSEEFAVYERSGQTLSRTCSVGIGDDGRPQSLVPGGPVWRSIETGEPCLPKDDEDLVACIPLKLDGEVTGVIVIYKLLAHKSELESRDFELFDLLASQAASALYCTSLQVSSRAMLTV